MKLYIMHYFLQLFTIAFNIKSIYTNAFSSGKQKIVLNFCTVNSTMKIFMHFKIFSYTLLDNLIVRGRLLRNIGHKKHIFIRKCMIVVQNIVFNIF